MKRLKLTIEGMHCASCSTNIERSLKKIKGIHDVSISLMTKKGFVEVDDTVKEEDLKHAVARAGQYRLIKIEGL